jgi:hypothetical protein
MQSNRHLLDIYSSNFSRQCQPGRFLTGAMCVVQYYCCLATMSENPICKPVRKSDFPRGAAGGSCIIYDIMTSICHIRLADIFRIVKLGVECNEQQQNITKVLP